MTLGTFDLQNVLSPTTPEGAAVQRPGLDARSHVASVPRRRWEPGQRRRPRRPAEAQEGDALSLWGASQTQRRRGTRNATRAAPEVEAPSWPMAA